MAQHELRDYQEAGIDNLRAALAQGDRRIMFQLPTGAGKTATAAAIIRSAVGKGKRVIFTVREGEPPGGLHRTTRPDSPPNAFAGKIQGRSLP